MNRIFRIPSAVALAAIAQLMPLAACGTDATRSTPPLAAPLCGWQVWQSNGSRVLSGTLPPETADAIVLRAVSARGAPARVDLAIRASSGIGALALSMPELSNGSGGTIPASAIDAMVVKRWYQDANGWFSGERAPGDPVPVPELLLRDDSIVTPDAAEKANIVRTPGGSATIHPEKAGSGDGVLADDDSAVLLPFPIAAGETRQLAFTIDIPENAAPGLYRGSVKVSGDGAGLGEIPIALRVIDFTLGIAFSRFSGRVSLDGREIPSGTSPAAVSTSPEPYRIIYFPPAKRMSGPTFDFFAKYGLKSPVLPPSVAPNAASLLGGVPDTIWVAPPLALVAEPEGVADQDALVAAARLSKASGAARINFFVPSRASGPQLSRDRAAMLALDDLGGISVWAHSTFATYTNSADVISAPFEYGLPRDKTGVGRPHVSANAYGGFEETDTRLVENWHALGTPCYLAITASAAVENPAFWRRAVGIQPFFLGYDGVILPRVTDETAPWGDHSNDYSRSRTLAYPAKSGFIPTLALAGIADGATDVRYLSAVRRLALAIRYPKPADAMADIEARKALQWMQNIDPRRCDMDALRLECIAWIEKLQAVLAGIGRSGDAPSGISETAGAVK